MEPQLWSRLPTSAFIRSSAPFHASESETDQHSALHSLAIACQCTPRSTPSICDSGVSWPENAFFLTPCSRKMFKFGVYIPFNTLTRHVRKSNDVKMPPNVREKMQKKTALTVRKKKNGAAGWMRRLFYCLTCCLHWADL
jgi:hypothetical protein